MKIKSIETFTNEFVSFTKLTADDGKVGWGQIAPYCADISATVLHRQVAPHAVGQEVPDTDGILGMINRIYEHEHKWPGSYMCRALGGLDTALWDLQGKIQSKSVCELLGGTVRPYPVYASSMRRDITAVDEAQRMAELQQKNGYEAFKFRVGSECGNDNDEWEGRSEEVTKQVRKSVGDSAKLLVDANSCYTPVKAIEVGRMLEDYGVSHFEEPCPYWEFDWTKQVTDALKLDVTGGEQDNNLQLWKYMIDDNIVDIYQPDISYLGGISRTLEVVKMLQTAGKTCTPHCANLSLVTVFTLHLMGAIPNAGKYLEFSIEGDDYYPWQKDLFNEPLIAKDGKVQIPEGPGWGIEVNSSWLEKSNHQITDKNTAGSLYDKQYR